MPPDRNADSLGLAMTRRQLAQFLRGLEAMGVIDCAPAVLDPTGPDLAAFWKVRPEELTMTMTVETVTLTVLRPAGMAVVALLGIFINGAGPSHWTLLDD